MDLSKMNNFSYVTPEEYWKIVKDDKNLDERINSLDKLKKLAEEPETTCDICEQNPVWKLGGCDMCFSCVTGETDASEDYELR